ncbi:MAG: sulfurtransferase complex subunit TusC [Candidatus Thiodiazotropha sp. (ex Lucinoma aequizonata)]|nr:sulfurtransferase complex subunit TusC [Candidatus Thiodiazotropha sp. (ex Lucinoma aequizonata)]MCU7888171.1 sulfurtransferase complex subunit TusC [Candidatus Thiodiazotropha sp. (ex Lucinoma aequizonata)]MCU7894250.1 sulfurtransferase complex subunit TusC [Candidatus Thiodiazotropha sp. (ex Lucinoma aequizonata)]MCU7898651.1 sulfurtransferase complex subunit TusC [Candidatus Thiodiazotropha sp. (ex Lucinoma aequizonata)]MCU7903145.1 sulfurtransferase complex subunit TusC [Candidatus Thiod
MPDIKKIMYINRRAPYGTIYAWESLEVVLIGAAFDQDVSLAFVDDGVFQLLKGQDTVDVEMKNFSATYKALGDYDVTKLYVEKESLEERGLTLEDLMLLTYEDEDDDWAEKDSIRLVSRAEMADIMDEQDVFFSF